MSELTVSLGSKLVQSLQKETAMQTPLPLTATARQQLTKVGEVEATVQLVDNDRLSHLATEVKIAVQPGKPSKSRSNTSAEGIAGRFAQRVTYLTEALQYVENDAHGAAILRSTPATMRGRRSEYFEVRVSPQHISLKRYQPNSHKAGREPVPFCVTDDVLSRLTDDGVAVLNGES